MSHRNPHNLLIALVVSFAVNATMELSHAYEPSGYSVGPITYNPGNPIAPVTVDPITLPSNDPPGFTGTQRDRDPNRNSRRNPWDPRPYNPVRPTAPTRPSGLTANEWLQSQFDVHNRRQRQTPSRPYIDPDLLRVPQIQFPPIVRQTTLPFNLPSVDEQRVQQATTRPIRNTSTTGIRIREGSRVTRIIRGSSRSEPANVNAASVEQRTGPVSGIANYYRAVGREYDPTTRTPVELGSNVAVGQPVVSAGSTAVNIVALPHIASNVATGRHPDTPLDESNSTLSSSRHSSAAELTDAYRVLEAYSPIARRDSVTANASSNLVTEDNAQRFVLEGMVGFGGVSIVNELQEVDFRRREQNEEDRRRRQRSGNDSDSDGFVVDENGNTVPRSAYEQEQRDRRSARTAGGQSRSTQYADEGQGAETAETKPRDLINLDVIVNPVNPEYDHDDPTQSGDDDHPDDQWEIADPGDDDEVIQARLGQDCACSFLTTPHSHHEHPNYQTNRQAAKKGNQAMFVDAADSKALFLGDQPTAFEIPIQVTSTFGKNTKTSDRKTASYGVESKTLSDAALEKLNNAAFVELGFAAISYEPFNSSTNRSDTRSTSGSTSRPQTRSRSIFRRRR